MKNDNFLLDRMRNILSSRHTSWEEKRMFGGNCFMVDEKMAFGTYKEGLMARVDPEETDLLIQRAGASLMVQGGRPMPGFIILEGEAYDTDADLEFWIDKCLEFNPKARSSKKKK